MLENRELHRNTLIYAASLAGSELELAVRLKVGVPRLRLWIDGIEEVPLEVFLGVVDIIAGSTPAERARSRKLLLPRGGSDQAP